MEVILHYSIITLHLVTPSHVNIISRLQAPGTCAPWERTSSNSHPSHTSKQSQAELVSNLTEHIVAHYLGKSQSRVSRVKEKFVFSKHQIPVSV